MPLSVSNDGGKTFRHLDGMHVDHHGLWIDPANPDYLVNANDGGIAVSYDRGRNWRCFTDNLPVCQFFNVSLDMASPFHVYGSMQDHGSFRGTVDLSRGRDRIPAVAFEDAPGGEGSIHAIDPTRPEPRLLRRFLRHAQPQRPRPPRPRARQTDRAARATPNEPAPARPVAGAVHPLARTTRTSFIYGMQYLFRSLDRGDTWERISPDLTANDQTSLGDIPYQTLFTISESPLKLRPALCRQRRRPRPRQPRQRPQLAARSLPACRGRKWVSRLVASPARAGHRLHDAERQARRRFHPLRLALGRFRQDLADIAAGIPLGPVNVIREDPRDPDTLYLGTDGAVFISRDDGASWQVLGGNLPWAYVHDLAVHPRENIIVIATHGRGMWALDAAPLVPKHRQGPGVKRLRGNEFAPYAPPPDAERPAILFSAGETCLI